MTISTTRRPTATSLVLAPILLGAALITDITPQADDTGELLSLIAQRPGAWSTGQTLFFLSALAWLPAAVGLLRIFAGSSRLGRMAALLVAVGALAILPVDAAGLYLRPLAVSDIDRGTQVALVEAVESSATVLVFETVHIVGLFLGLLLVGVAMLRHAALPRWAGALVLLGTLGLVVAPAGLLLALPVALLAVGLGVAAFQVARTGDDSASVIRAADPTPVVEAAVAPHS